MKANNLFSRITNWELWPFYVLYFPIGFVWIWYCIKARSLWFFSSSNPTITFGGFEGESKKEMYDQLPPLSYPKTIYILHDLSFDEVKKKGVGKWVYLSVYRKTGRWHERNIVSEN